MLDIKTEEEETIRLILGADLEKLDLFNYNKSEIAEAIRLQLQGHKPRAMHSALINVVNDENFGEEFRKQTNKENKITIIKELVRALDDKDKQKNRKLDFACLLKGDKPLLNGEEQNVLFDSLDVINDEDDFSLAAAMISSIYAREGYLEELEDKNNTSVFSYLYVLQQVNEEKFMVAINKMAASSPEEKANIFARLCSKEVLIGLYLGCFLGCEKSLLKDFIHYIEENERFYFIWFDTEDQKIVLQNAYDKDAKAIFEDIEMSSTSADDKLGALKAEYDDTEWAVLLGRVGRTITPVGGPNPVTNSGGDITPKDIWTKILNGEDETEISHLLKPYTSYPKDEDMNDFLDGMDESAADKSNVTTFKGFDPSKKVRIISLIIYKLKQDKHQKRVFDRLKKNELLDEKTIVHFFLSLGLRTAKDIDVVRALFDSDYAEDTKKALSNVLKGDDESDYKTIIELLLNLHKEEDTILPNIMNGIDAKDETKLFDNIINSAEENIEPFITIFTDSKRTNYVEHLYAKGKLDFSNKTEELQNVILAAAPENIKESILSTLPPEKKAAREKAIKTEELNEQIKDILTHDYSSRDNAFVRKVKGQMALIPENNQATLFVDRFREALNDATLVDNFKKDPEKTAPAKATILNMILIYLPGTKLGNDLLAAFKGQSLLSNADLEEMLANLSTDEAVERLHARQLVTSAYGKDLIDSVILNSTKKNKEDKVTLLIKLIEIDKDLRLQNNNVISNAIDGIASAVQENLFENIVNRGLVNEFIGFMPNKLKKPYLEYLYKNNKLNISSLSPEQKITVIEHTSDKTRDELIAVLSDKEKKEVLEYLKSQTNKEKEIFTSTLDRAKKIKKNIRSIQGTYIQLLLSRPGIALKKGKVAFKRFFVTHDMKRLHAMNEFPASSARIGLINTARLALFGMATSAYERDYAALKKAEENLQKSIDAREEKIKYIENARAAVTANSEVMKNNINEYFNGAKAKRKEITAAKVQRFSELLSNKPKKKDDKVGKFENKEVEVMAWAYLVHYGPTIPKDEDIRKIITDNKELIGVTNEVDLRNLIAKIQKRVAAMKLAYSSDGENLDTEHQEEFVDAMYQEAGMRRRGMSNYILIVGVIAITISLLVVMLTMILS